jgi:hypothetical protein
LPTKPQGLPFDQQQAERRGLWLRPGELAAWFNTCRIIWRHPYATFAELVDGDSDHSWRFAWLTHTFGLFFLAFLYSPSPNLLISAPLLAAFTSTFEVFSSGTARLATHRLLGHPLTWSLALRSAGYSAAWWLPAWTLEPLVMIAPNVPFSVLSVLVFGLSQLVMQYAFGRGRAGLSIARASYAGVLALVPVLLAHIWILYLRTRPGS